MMNIYNLQLTESTMLSKALVIAVLMASMATVATTLALQTDVFAPSGRRWTPSVSDEITYQNGVMTSKLNPEYPVEYLSCTVTQNAAVAGHFTADCTTYD